MRAALLLLVACSSSKAEPAKPAAADQMDTFTINGYLLAGAEYWPYTGTEDIAIEGCRNSVNGTMSPALYANWEGGTHTGTATIAGFIGGDAGTKQYMRLYTAWFRDGTLRTTHSKVIGQAACRPTEACTRAS
jgi:hypothetical protein